jgi:hypothetical protein
MRRLTLVPLAAVLPAAAGCSTAAGDTGTGGRTVRVVAAENFWGSLAAQLGGGHATVRSIIDNPDADPHDYEPTVADALLILGLLAGPAGAAVRLTDRPLRGLALSAGIAVGSVLLGLAADLVPVLPPSFAIMAVVAGAYLVACAAGRRRGQVPGEPVRGALAYTRSMVSGRRARR